MQNSIRQQIEIYLKQKKYRQIRRRFVSVMACLVVLCTVSALAMPAVTVDQQTFHGPMQTEDPPVPEKSEDPAKPIEPETTGKPTEPETTGKPTEPETTGKPTEPETTGKPTEPETTGKPTEPETTGKPTEPETTGKPTEPETTGKPTEPETTGKQTEPETTVQPTEPEPTGRNPVMLPGLQQAPQDIDMEPMILAIDLQYRSGDGSQWMSLENGGTVLETDQIQCTISYRVPPFTLSPTQNTIFYQSPEGLTLDKVESGIVYDEGGYRVGTYTIDTNGLIRITFDPEYVEKNGEGGKAITGTITFKGMLDSSKINEDGTVDLPFGEDYQISIKVIEQDQVRGDIQVGKRAERTPEGLIAYTVTVSSTEGTFGPVTLTDTMTGAAYHSGLAVQDAAGNPVAVSIPPAAGAASFVLTLPQMGENSKYVVTYLAKPDEVISGSSADNQVKTESVSSDQLPIDATASTKTPFRMLEKTGVFQPETNTVLWTVTVNRDGRDLSGWVLEDFITGTQRVEYTGPITVTDSAGNTVSASMPYTFPAGSTDTYTITYETEVHQSRLGVDSVTNDAVLKKDGETIFRVNHTESIGEFQPAAKQAGTVAAENGNAVIPWTVTMDFTDRGLALEEGQYYTVTDLTNVTKSDHYLTAAQMNGAKSAITEAFAAKGITVSHWQAYEYGTGETLTAWPSAEASGKFRGFQFRITDPIAKGTLVEFTYETTGSAGDGSASVTYENQIGIDRAWVKAETTYTPAQIKLEKIDPAYPDQEESRHVLQRLPDGELSWQIQIFVPEGARQQEITVTEQLPAHVVLSALELTAGSDPRNTATAAFGAWNGDEATALLALKPNPLEGIFERITVTARKNASGQIVIDLPTRLSVLAAGSYRLTVRVRLDEAAIQWTQESESTRIYAFENRVSVCCGDSTVSDVQTQVVADSDLTEVVSKTGTMLSDTNIVAYSVTINPRGRDLHAGSDTLILNDELRFHDNGNQFRANLVVGSVQVHRRNADGTAGEQISAPFTSEESRDPDTGKQLHLLHITIPDGEPLILTYRYRFSGKAGVQTSVTNRAWLQGVVTDDTQQEEKLEVQVQESGATANLEGVHIYKVDMDDHGILLPGAEFELYRWNGTVYEKVNTPPLISNADGEIPMSSDLLTYNTAYQLVETQAPEGYFRSTQPCEFCIGNDNTTTYPMCLPDPFAGHRHGEGDNCYFENQKQTAELRLKKLWLDEDGKPLNQSELTEVTVRLYQRTAGGTKTLYGTYTLKASENWTMTVKDLPVAVRNPDGTAGEAYLYCAEEDPVPGFSVCCGSETAPAPGAVLEITNQKETGYTLPATGGTGLAPFLLAGLGCVSGSAALLLRRKKR